MNFPVKTAFKFYKRGTAKELHFNLLHNKGQYLVWANI